MVVVNNQYSFLNLFEIVSEMLKIEINMHYNKHECSVLLMDCEFYLSFYSNNWVVYRTDYVALLCCSISFNILQAASFQFLFNSDS